MATSTYGDTPSRLAPLGAGNMNRNLAAAREQAYFDLQRKIQDLLVVDLETSKGKMDQFTSPQAQREVEVRLHRIIDAEVSKQQLPLSKSERNALFARCMAEILGYGPIEPLLHDENVTEIMVCGPNNIWVDQIKGKPMKTNLRFQDDAHLMRIIERIVSQIGRRVDETTPMVDARLRDGSRVNIVIPPIALDGAILTIRKFAARPLQPQNLIESGTVSPDMMLFLQRCVEARMNVIVSGGTNTGKTTLLNVLSVFIPPNQRIVTIEDSAELQLQQEHVIRMESRPANVEGKNQISIRSLVANALRMRPDRIIVGECRGGEALDMLQAMNTGHEGSMTTLHANSSHDVLNRLQMLVLQAGIELPERAIHEQILSAVNLIVQLKHFEDGSRRIASIAELRRGGGDSIEVIDLFEFERTGMDAKGRVTGRLRATGVRPRLLETMESLGFPVPPTMFQK